MHITELIGPSGAGKTTVAQKLSKPSNVYAGRDGNDRARCFLKSLPAGELMTSLPYSFQRLITRRIFPSVRSRYERAFFSKFPGALETIAAIVRNYDDKKSVLRYMFREAAWFEIHSNQLKDNERYLIDDGLYQFHLRLLPIDGWNPSEIMDRLYVPDELVFVNATAEICLSRQESRERGRASKLEHLGRSDALAKLEIMQTAAKEFLSEAKARGVDVKVVETD